LRLEVTERVNAKGLVLKEVDEKEVLAILEAFQKEEIESIAVSLLFSFYNSANEKKIGGIINRNFPKVYVTLSSEILPEIREFERTSTTVLNACVTPIINRYFENIENGIEKLGVPERLSLQVMRSNGGIMKSVVAKKECIHTAFSGPAAGAIFGTWLAEEIGFPNVITFDMGGTSSDICLIKDGEPFFTTEGKIGSYVSKIPAIDIHTLGAGGGSIAWIDEGGIPRVGPQSAGASPGPACYGLGGKNPTVTDTNLLLGRLDTNYFLGGGVLLNLDLARDSLMEKIANPIGLDVVEAAEGVLKIAIANIVRGFRVVSIEKGHDPRDFALVAFGGAGPMHAGLIASEIGMKTIIVPKYPGVASAMGLLVADLKHDFVRTYLKRIENIELDELKEVLNQLEKRGIDVILNQGIARKNVILHKSFDMRYVGQGYEINVPTPRGINSRFQKELTERFFREYERKYGFSNRKEKIEVVNVRLTALGVVSKIRLPKMAKAQRNPVHALKGMRPAYFSEFKGYRKCRIYERNKLSNGNIVEGPAVIEQYDSTTIVIPNQTASVDMYGNLIIKL
jgi:N-methylhydantoinase A